MVLIIWAIDPQYRLNAMIATTVVLLVAAMIGGIRTLRKRAKSNFPAPMPELANDRALLGMTSREPIKRNVEAKSVPVSFRSSSNGWDQSASRRDWIDATRRFDRSWNTFPSLRSWALVEAAAISGRFVISHAHPLGTSSNSAPGAPGVW